MNIVRARGPLASFFKLLHTRGYHVQRSGKTRLVGHWFTDFGARPAISACDETRRSRYALDSIPVHGRAQRSRDIKAFIAEFRGHFPDLNVWGLRPNRRGDYVSGRWEGGAPPPDGLRDFLIGSLRPRAGGKMNSTGRTYSARGRKIVEDRPGRRR